jgi:hypothetical protein
MSAPVIPLESCFHTILSRFGSHWDNLPQRLKEESVIMDYAKEKLLDGSNELRDGNWGGGSLACLSIRFALEFSMDGTRLAAVRSANMADQVWT